MNEQQSRAMHGEDAAMKPNIKLSFDSSMTYQDDLINVSTEKNMPKKSLYKWRKYSFRI